MTLIPAARLEDLWEGEMLGVVVAGRKIVLVHLGGEVHAYEDQCAHQRVALSQGRLTGNVLTCAAHEWQYDALTGKGLNPCDVTLRRFAVKVIDGAVLVEVPA